MAALTFTINTAQFQKEIEKDLGKFVKTADVVLSSEFDRAEGEAVQAVPVDTGFLKGAIFKKRDATLAYELGANAFYAPFIEFGTGKGVRIPAGYEQLARDSGNEGIAKSRQLRGGNGRGGGVNPNIRARPYLIPAFERAIKRFLDKMSKVKL